MGSNSLGQLTLGTVVASILFRPGLHLSLHAPTTPTHGQQPLHRIPLVQCDDVKAEPTKLLEAGIIEPVKASPWISNLVMQKRNQVLASVCGPESSEQGLLSQTNTHCPLHNN